jgi:hypothetical protein
VHGTRVYSAGVCPKGPALERFLDINFFKKNNNLGLVLAEVHQGRLEQPLDRYSLETPRPVGYINHQQQTTITFSKD